MQTRIVANPVLRGFNPDPSICLAGDTFYIATSTFEWFPGIQIWESHNLGEWRLRVRPLNEPRLLDMRGVQSSGGIWAPCLSWRSGVFFLAYTVVRNWRGETGFDTGAFKDTPNYVVRADSIDGPWSDPVFVNSSGFDPSIFHDDDGRSWFLNMEWDYRNSPTHFTGILLQEFDRESLLPFGPVRKIFRGTEIDRVEGPHIYKHEGWYYLVTAEGGTGFEHAVTVARSLNLAGPYEVHPANPVLSSLEDRHGDLGRITRLQEAAHARVDMPQGFYTRPQKAGHASMCELEGDEWIMVHLASRPFPGSASCPLGRETCIQRVRWIEGWPNVMDNENAVSRFPLAEVRLPVLPPTTQRGIPPAGTAPSYSNGDTGVTDTFGGPALHPAFRFLRRHPGSSVSLTARPGCLRLIGCESPVSVFSQTLVAMAVTSFSYRAETCLEFEPESFQQMAGLIVRYDERNQYYLRIAGSGAGRRTLGIIRFFGGALDLPLQPEINLPDGPVALTIEADGDTARFSWSSGGETHRLPVELDMLRLSDEATWPMGFTGTFVGMTCNDMTGRGLHADFSMFTYTET